jgi:DASH complex subunit DAD3
MFSARDQPLQTTLPAAAGENETLTPLEQEVLDEYARLLGNLNNVRASVFLSSHPAKVLFSL